MIWTAGPQVGIGAYKILKLIKRHRSAIVFCFRFTSLFFLWKVFFYFTWRTPQLLIWYNEFSLDVISLLLKGTYALMTGLGENMELDHVLRIIRIKGTVGVTVGEPCIGFELDAIFLALILSASGKWIHKSVFLVLGLTMLTFLNIARIATLSYLVEINPWLWEVNHKFVFSTIIYCFLFCLWLIWLHNFSTNKKKV